METRNKEMTLHHVEQLRTEISAIIFFFGFMPAISLGILLLNTIGIRIGYNTVEFATVAKWTFFAALLAVPLIIRSLYKRCGEIERILS